MKILLSIFAYLLFTSALYAQPGFNKWYDFGSGAAFHNIMAKEDTLIIAGTVLDLEEDRWGALFMKMDTMGTILDHQIHLDEQDGQLAFNQGYPLLYDENKNRYIISGDIFDRNSDFILILDEQGNKLQFLELPYPQDILTSRIRKIYLLDDGYLLFLHRQISNAKIQLSIAKINENGAIQWEVFHANSYNNEALLTDVWQKDESTFIIGAGFGNSSSGSVEDWWSKSWIFAVDTLGNMLWEWESDFSAENGIRGIQQLNSGEWMYSTNSFNPVNSTNFYFTPKVVRRDNNFNLIWEYELTASQSDDNASVNLIPSPDGHWIGVGHWIQPEDYILLDPPPNEEVYHSGCMYKLTDTGDSLWLYCDTAIVENGYAHNIQTDAMTVLPSGSTIAVGRATISDGESRPAGWVFKRDRDGCMEELCVLTGTENLSSTPLLSVKTYPNPASQFTTFEWEGQQAHLWIMDATGRVIHRANMEDKYVWPTAAVPSGIYFYRLKGAVQQTGRISIQH